MMGIASKLKSLINDQSVNQWARDHGLPPQTVHEWIKRDRMPRSAGLKTLIDATGMPKEWWLRGEGCKPEEINQYPSVAPALTRVVARDSIAATQMSLNDFANMPKYAIKSIRNNHAASVESEQVVDYLAFKKDWLQYSMNIYDQALALIRIKGDSMAPTLRNDDLILTDLSQSRIDDDSIYVLSIKNELVVKRIQRKLNGSFVIMTDNDAYKPEEMNEEDAMSLPVIGKVVWFGRRI